MATRAQGAQSGRGAMATHDLVQELITQLKLDEYAGVAIERRVVRSEGYGSKATYR